MKPYEICAVLNPTKSDADNGAAPEFAIEHKLVLAKSAQHARDIAVRVLDSVALERVDIYVREFESAGRATGTGTVINTGGFVAST